MREDRFLSRRRREGLINVTPFWAILMAKVKDPEPGGGAAGNVDKHVHARKNTPLRLQKATGGGLRRSCTS